MKKGSNSNLKPTSFGKRRNGKAKKAYSKSEQKPKTYRGQGR
jgi:DNA-binding protein H-NS